MQNRPSSKWKWSRFGLRSLLVGTMIIAIPLAWLAFQMQEGQRHLRISAKLQSLGCSVQLSHREWVKVPLPMSKGAGSFYQERSTLPSFLENLQLSSALRRIDGVTLHCRNDAELANALGLLKNVEQLSSVSFYDTGVSETQLSELIGSKRVGKLYLRGEHLPRTRMPWLNNDSLTWICFSRTQFSNAAIDDLPISLTYFDATRTRINDEGLRSFVRLKNLQTLKLRRTPTTLEAVDNLRTQMPWCDISWELLKRP